MGVKIASAIVVLYVLAAGGVSFCFWEVFSKGEPSISATIRNLVLIWGAPLATGLAVWRSMVAQKQVEIAQRGLLSDRYQRAVEMLGHDLASIRLGGILALENTALEHYKEYGEVVNKLLIAHLMYPNPRHDSNNPRLASEKAEKKEAERARSAIKEHGKHISQV